MKKPLDKGWYRARPEDVGWRKPTLEEVAELKIAVDEYLRLRRLKNIAGCFVCLGSFIGILYLLM